MAFALGRGFGRKVHQRVFVLPGKDRKINRFAVVFNENNGGSGFALNYRAVGKKVKYARFARGGKGNDKPDKNERSGDIENLPRKALFKRRPKEQQHQHQRNCPEGKVKYFKKNFDEHGVTSFLSK